jgi:glycosyltransferase involved in cell wall biosynthesis
MEELLITLPQIVNILDKRGELIVLDQSDKYDLELYKSELNNIAKGKNVRYLHSPTPSVPLAWNTAAEIAQGTILLFLDDDIDLEYNIIEVHLALYREDNIIGVAGSYYAGHRSRKWIPSSNSKTATALAGVNMSFRRNVFIEFGAATWFIKPFAGVDWELAEVMGIAGKIAVGDTCFVFHRAPADGGCGNQGTRSYDWYYGAYFNHTLWLLSRPFPKFLTLLPRHFYWLFRYCLPAGELALTKRFFSYSIFKAISDAYKVYKTNDKIRSHVTNSAQLRVIIKSEHS